MEFEMFFEWLRAAEGDGALGTRFAQAGRSSGPPAADGAGEAQGGPPGGRGRNGRYRLGGIVSHKDAWREMIQHGSRSSKSKSMDEIHHRIDLERRKEMCRGNILDIKKKKPEEKKKKSWW